MKPKSIATAGLLPFVAASIGVAIGKGAGSPAKPPEATAGDADRPQAGARRPRAAGKAENRRPRSDYSGNSR